MALPLVVAGIAARAAAKKVAKKVATKAAKNTIKKGTKSTKGQGISTGKAKIEAYKKSSTKKYEQPVKGSGKPKYQNVIKEARLQPKRDATIVTSMGKKLSSQQITRKASKSPNLAKQIDREYKVQKGIRTEKSSVKVPIKKRGK
jgi:thiamine pyrophosphate-dependent acetolactate synthase large subunit-like protein